MLTRKMKDSGIEWIGKIPEEWEVKKARYFLLEKSERNYPDEMVLSLYRDYGVIPRDSRNDNHNVTSLNTASYKLVRKNNLVINKMKAWQGSMGISKYQGIISPAYFIFEVTDSNLNKDFLHYAFRNPAYIQEYKRISAGLRVGQWDLNKQEFKNILYPFPKSSGLQKKIVKTIQKKVKEIESIVSNTDQSIEELKKYKQSLITEAVTKGLDPNVEMKDSGIEWIGDIPEDWKLTRLKFLLKSNLLYGANESGIPYSPSLPRYIRITDIIENNKLTSENKLSLSKEKAENYLLKEGDILFARSGASVGKTFLVESQNTNNAFAGYLIKASFKNNVTSKFVYYYTLSSAFEVWKDSITIQSTIQNIGADKYNNLPLPIPSKYLQQEIVSYLDEQTSRIDKLIEDKTKVIEELESYKKSLIYEYVTGKKEV